MQPDTAWEDPEQNYARVERLLDAADIAEGDIVALPEMFAVGFSLNTNRTCLASADTLRFLLRLADDFGCLVLGGRPVQDCDCAKADNRLTAVGPEERLFADYTKVHPFSFGREPEAFSAGSNVAVFAWPPSGARHATLRICPVICYDLRFPELFRLGLAQGADLFVVAANWPAARQSHWRALAIARAIENQAYVAAVNRTGNDPHLAYKGGTIVVDPKGEIVGEIGNGEGVLSVEIDPEIVRTWRAEFPAWRDGRLMPELDALRRAHEDG